MANWEVQVPQLSRPRHSSLLHTLLLKNHRLNYTKVWQSFSQFDNVTTEINKISSWPVGVPGVERSLLYEICKRRVSYLEIISLRMVLEKTIRNA